MKELFDEKMPSLPPRYDYTINVENVALQVLVDLDLSHDSYNSNILITMHTHAYAEVFLCLDGKIEIETESDLITLSKGDLIIVPANYPHVLLTENLDGVWHAIGVLPTKKRTKNANNLYGTIAGLCFGKQLFLKRNCYDLCSVIENVACFKKHGSILPATNVLQVLLTVIESGHRLNSNKEALKGNINIYAQIEYTVNTLFATNVKTKDVADKLFISPRQLERLAKRRFGTSLHQAILKKRMQTAVKSLKETNLSVEQIGLSVGYKTPSCFYRAFLKELGVTPNNFREKFRKKTK